MPKGKTAAPRKPRAPKAPKPLTPEQLNALAHKQAAAVFAAMKPLVPSEVHDEIAAHAATVATIAGE